MNHLAHVSWECKYHIGAKVQKTDNIEIGKILKKLCERKAVEMIRAQCCPDHVHMLISIPPKYSVSEIVGYLKGKSFFITFDEHTNLKYKYRNRTVLAQSILC